MRKEISLPPEWQPASVLCPKCRAPARARFSPQTGALEALRCTSCTWIQNYVQIAADRKNRLKRIASRNPPSQTLQSSLPKQPPK